MNLSEHIKARRETLRTISAKLKQFHGNLDADRTAERDRLRSEYRTVEAALTALTLEQSNRRAARM